MPVFIYTARSRTGEKSEGSVEASDRRTAVLQLERQGLTPVSIEEKTAAAVKKEAINWRSLFSMGGHRLRMNSREMLLFTSELSDLLSSGMQLGNALNILCHRRANKSSDLVIKALRDDIVQGTSLSKAMAKFPDSFPSLYVSLVHAGETAGNLAEIMQRVVRHFEQVQEVKEKVMMALIYPAIVLVVGIATIIFSMVKVIPQFSQIFKELGGALPLPTQIIIDLSSFLLSYGWLLLIAVIVVVILFQRYISTQTGKIMWHAFHLKMPLIRDIVMASSLSQFSRTLGMLIANGVPVLDALAIGEKTVSNSIISAEIHKARERVTDGTTISGPLAAGKVFPQMLTDMLAIGEETGDMSRALNHIARRYENNLDRSIKIFTTVLEPVLIVLMALIVGFVAVSILLAVYDITSSLHV
jgi:type II secretory pathway component PulF